MDDSGQHGGMKRREKSLILAPVALLAGLTLLAGCSSQSTPASPGPAPTTASASASVTPTASASGTVALDGTASVYFLVDAPGGIRLARETRGVPAQTPARGAVEAMIAGPQDPDYTSPWNPATRVLGLSESGGVITVDLSSDARTASIGSEGAAAMVHQLIYTVTEAMDASASVRLHIDGAPAGELWGVLEWSDPQPRADWMETRLFVGIDTPTEGAGVTSPVTVSGEAAVYEANLPWRVLTMDGSEVRRGNTMTAEGQTMAPYSFEIDLDPGDYIIEVTEDDPSAGEGRDPHSDTRTITVTG